jgi:hypothetical protein
MRDAAIEGVAQHFALGIERTVVTEVVPKAEGGAGLKTRSHRAIEGRPASSTI